MANDVHRESLQEEARNVIEECRMVLPGVQALLGFQFIAAFNARFAQLDPAERALHYAALLVVGIAMVLIMTPAAYHRQAERGVVSRHFIDLASRLLTTAMVPLAIGICLDVYIVGLLALGHRALAIAAALLMFALLASLWFVLPASKRRRMSGG